MRKSIVSAVVALSVSVFAGSVFAQVSVKLPEPGWAPPGSPVAVHGALKVGTASVTIDGQTKTIGAILDKNNNPVALRGVSLFWASAGEGAGGAYYNESVVGWLAHDWRVSVVRAAISGGGDGENGASKGGGDGYDKAPSTMMNYARNVIEACIKRGIYVLVDWHIESSSANEAKAKEFFGQIAQQYGDYPNVIYEVWNEPLTPGWTTIKTYAQNVITEIRGKGGNGVVVVGSEGWSSKPNQAIGDNNKVADSKSNTAYSMHFYAATHSFSSGHGSNMTAAVDAGLAVLATEWGLVSSTGDGSPNSSATDTWITEMEKRKVGWAGWALTHKKEGGSMLTASGSSGGPWSLKDETGGYVRRKIVGYNNTAYSNWGKTYSITATASEGGRVEKRVGNAVSNGPYDYGVNVTLAPIPDDGYEFANWEGDASGTNASLTYKVTGVVNVNIKAAFIPASMIKNGYFISGTANWSSASAELARNSGEGGFLEVRVNGSASPGRVQQAGIKSLVPRTKYELSFKAKTASGTRKITPWVTNSGRNRVYNKDTSAVDIGSAWQEKKIEFTMCYETAGEIVTESNATLAFMFNGGGSDWAWHLDDVALNPVGQGTCPGTAALPAAAAGRASWSLVGAGGALQLRGPSAAGARVSIYDVRGKVVRSAAAKDGMTLGAGIPAGSYFVVVKNRAGSEVYRTKMVMAK